MSSRRVPQIGEPLQLSDRQLRALAELVADRVAAALATPTWLTPAEAAEVLSVPAATLAQWRFRGNGPRYSKVGALVRYDRAALDEWLVAGVVLPRSA